MMQLQTIALLDEAKTPPPSSDGLKVEPARVAPPPTVKPLRIALFVIHTQRIAAGPLVVAGSHAPWMTVAAAPFTLWTRSALSIETRFVMMLSIDFPPVA